ncbi:MAG: VWA domain-containing protein [Blastocatellia bacterium]|nr:VWA domain-containing protein [Blastocatellia bacterium]
MQSSAPKSCIATLIALILTVGALAQSGRPMRRGEPVKKEAQPQESKQTADDDKRDQDAVKLDTTLVTVPVVVSDRNGLYIPDMRQEEFTVYEDGVEQEVVFFATIKEPFHVALMLDTSASTQEKLIQIQRAAKTFVEQLQPDDRVKVISFDDQVRDLGDFTSDRAALKAAIERTQTGQGTRLYDAVRLALSSLRYVAGRKAIVIFTDGVDWRSDSSRYEDNIREVEESGVIVYPIRYDTRAETEQLARDQQRGGESTGPPIILSGPPVITTPPTVPGGDSPIPGGRTGGKKDPWELPSPPARRPGTRTDRDEGYPGGRRYPDNRRADPRFPDERDSEGGLPPSDAPNPRRPGPPDDNISVMLDNAYRTADAYLKDLAARSGGKLHRADTLGLLPAAFAQIADELRTQYMLGYYPSNAARDGSYRRIRVRASRKNVAVRARPGYRAPDGVGKTDPDQR